MRVSYRQLNVVASSVGLIQHGGMVDLIRAQQPARDELRDVPIPLARKVVVSSPYAEGESAGCAGRQRLPAMAFHFPDCPTCAEGPHNLCDPDEDEPDSSGDREHHDGADRPDKRHHAGDHSEDPDEHVPAPLGQCWNIDRQCGRRDTLEYESNADPSGQHPHGGAVVEVAEGEVAQHD
jgi:hypothetical protein